MANGILPQFSDTICSMFKQRLNQLKEKIEKEKLDAVLISSVSNIEYLTGYSNFSKDEREAYIFIGKNFSYIITDGRYTEAVKREVAHLTLFERGHERSVEFLFKKHKNEIDRLGIEEDNLTVGEFKKVKKHFKNIKHFNVGHLRSIKTKEEIQKIEKACQIGDLAFEHIIKQIKVDVTEKEIAEELEKFISQSDTRSAAMKSQAIIKGNGADISFPPIVAFGKNSSVPHHQTGPSTLFVRSGREGLIILLDFGVKVDGYCSDMTRTVVLGKTMQKQREIYRVVLEAQMRAVDFLNRQIKSGKKVKASEVDKVAREYIRSQGFPTIPHSLGHGIGLEVHEHPSLSPKSKDILREGMVFSIEPGIYLPGFGGVRIEDLYVLEKNGLRQITNTPKDLIIV